MGADEDRGPSIPASVLAARKAKKLEKRAARAAQTPIGWNSRLSKLETAATALYGCGSTSRTRGPASEADCERRGGGASRDRETAENDGTGTHGREEALASTRRNVARVHRPITLRRVPLTEIRPETMDGKNVLDFVDEGRPREARGFG